MCLLPISESMRWIWFHAFPFASRASGSAKNGAPQRHVVAACEVHRNAASEQTARVHSVFELVEVRFCVAVSKVPRSMSVRGSD